VNREGRQVTVQLTVLCDAGFSDEMLLQVLRDRCVDLGLPVMGSQICNQKETKRLPKLYKKVLTKP